MIKPSSLLPRCSRAILLSGLIAGCVAGSEGPRGPGLPTDPDSDFGMHADLSPGPIEAPDRVRLDSILEMTVAVRNLGNRTAEAGWVIRVFLSNDRIIDSADIQVDHFAAPRDLQPGSEDLYLRHKKLRGSTPPGAYFIGSILDVTLRVPEVTEGNNTLQSPSTITLESRSSGPRDAD